MGRVFWVALAAFLVLGRQGSPVFADAERAPRPHAEGSASAFFEDKFACVRWVEAKAQDAKCLECHAGILSEEDLASSLPGKPAAAILSIHAQHMRSGKVNFRCTTCHQRIDPYQASSEGLRDQVSANLCFKCHFPHGQQ